MNENMEVEKNINDNEVLEIAEMNENIQEEERANDDVLLDTKFYYSYYPDLGNLQSEEDLLKHWQNYGKSEKRFPNIMLLSQAMGFSSEFSRLDKPTIIQLNPNLSDLSKSEIFLKLLQIKEIMFIRTSKEIESDVQFYKKLGRFYLFEEEEEKGSQLLLYALFLKVKSDSENNDTEKYVTLFDTLFALDDNTLDMSEAIKNIFAVKYAESLSALYEYFPALYETSATKIEAFKIERFLEVNSNLEPLLLNCSEEVLESYFIESGLDEIQKGIRPFDKEYIPFNENLYQKMFQDIKLMIRDSNSPIKSGFDHFCHYGYKEIINGERHYDHELNTEFYMAYYDDLQSLESEDAIYRHWEEYGLHEKRYPNIIQFSKGIGFKFDLLELNFKKIIHLNPFLSSLNQNEIYIKLLQIKKIDFIRISDESKYDANFYLLLGKSYLMHGEKDKAYQILLYSLYLEPTSECSELIGNYFLDQNKHKKAITFYTKALSLDSSYKSLWVHININKIYRMMNNFSAALENVVVAFRSFPQNSYLLNILDDTIEEAWNFEQESLHALAAINDRNTLIRKVDIIISQLSKIYTDVFNHKPLDSLTRLNRKRILIIGDFHISQCIRYRIDQKAEQLTLADYEVTKVSWTDLQEKYEEIFFNDIIIYYRVPSMPIVIKSIEKAKSLKKVTFF